MVCDSTNALSDGESGSESDVFDALHNIMEKSKNLVVITMFASNIHRIATVCKIAKMCNRKVMISGKSLIRVTNVAQRTGFLKDCEFYNEDESIDSERNKYVLLCTGCQGEEMAAANRLSINTHRFITLKAGDVIIFSAKIIPGNGRKINDMCNRFINIGVEVHTEKSAKVHVSGHPSRGELCRMYSYIRPNTLIPVHGEISHLKAHCELVKNDENVKNSCLVCDGDVILIEEDNCHKIDEASVGIYGIDGNTFQSEKSNVMHLRGIMGKHGVVFAVLIFNKKNNNNEGRFNTDDYEFKAKVYGPGIINIKQDLDVIEKLRNGLENLMHSMGPYDKFLIKRSKAFIRQEVLEILGKRPVITVHIVPEPRIKFKSKIANDAVSAI